MIGEPRLSPFDPGEPICCPNCNEEVGEWGGRLPSGLADCERCGARVAWDTDTGDGETLSLFVSADPDIEEMKQALRAALDEREALDAEITEWRQRLAACRGGD